MTREEILIERAVSLIVGEWNYTRERAREWLEDDSADWDLNEQPITANGSLPVDVYVEAWALPHA